MKDKLRAFPRKPAPAAREMQIRSYKADGSLVSVKMNRGKAIKAMCTECLGYEGNAKTDCTSPNCPLYPWRGKTLAAWGK